MNIIFWNTQEKDTFKSITTLSRRFKNSIFALTELNLNTETQASNILHQITTPGHEKVKLFTDMNLKIHLLNQDSYYSLILVKMPKTNYIFGFVHFPAKISETEDSQKDKFKKFSLKLQEEEVKHSTSNTLIIGDFNCNPFESPMVSFYGLGASNGLSCSDRKCITHYKEIKKIFYNPTWILYDKYKINPGSYYLLKTTENILTWHYLDQVIIRPDLVEQFVFKDFQLITKIGRTSFVKNNGRPLLSDHLPLRCRLELV